jgi:6-phosphogluconolactonase
MLRSAERAVTERGRFVVALSGGSTPLPLFRLLADAAADTAIPWAAFHLFWADERMVPYDHPESNYGTARRVMLDTVPIPRDQIHPIPVDDDPAESAGRYTLLLQELAVPSGDGATETLFDFVLLGMGSDGHTASIFPGSPAYRLALGGEASTLALPATAPSPPLSRVTLTATALGRGREVVFMVTGDGKREAVRRILDGTTDPPPPAALIHASTGSVTWLLDEAATPAGRDPAIHP